MSTQSGFVGVWCPRCDKAGTPARVVRQMAAKQEGMLVKCTGCGQVYNYAALMAQHPRMDKVEFVEKQPAGFITLPLWLHPDAAEALKRKFPSNLLTTLSSAVTSLADPDSVLIEGPYAREMAAIGVKTGRQVLGMAKELKELREANAAMKLKEDTLRQFFSGMGVAMPQLASQPSPSPAADNLAPPIDAAGNPLAPPHAQFAQLRDDGSGLLVPADGSEPVGPTQFTMPTGPATGMADGRPGFVVGTLR